LLGSLPNGAVLALLSYSALAG